MKSVNCLAWSTWRLVLTLVLSGIWCGGPAAWARKEARVLVDSFATPEYLEKKEVDGQLRRETYHFFQGRYFGGNIRDPSLREVPFQEVVTTLANEMRARNYFPEKDPKAGDFLIVVHWGVTGVEETFDELFLNEPTSDGFDSGFDEEASDTFGSDQTTTFESLDQPGASRSDKDNAALIGFDRALRRKGLMPQDEYELKAMLRDERYFIVLMAFDWQKLLADREFKLVWSTRFSLDAIGTNFKDAHFALSRGASSYFGTNLDGKLGKTKTHLGPGDVDLGEIEVVGTVEEPEAPKK